MTWTASLGPLFLAAALLLLPGLLVALAAGRRGFAAIGLAPALSLTALAVGGILGDLVGVPWGWWTPVATSALLALAAWGVSRLIARWSPLPDAPTGWRAEWPLWTGALVAAALMVRHLRRIQPTPDTFSQLFDNVFHLSLIRFFAENRTGSSLAEGGLTPGSGPWFYPAAFHDLASLVLLAFPQSIAVATTAAVWVVVALAWPLGCLYLVSRLFPRPTPLVVGAGVLTASLPSFPFVIMSWGVLYPNMLGLALLPAALGLTIEALGLGRGKNYDPRALLVGALVLPGVALGHPSALLSLFVPATVLLVARTIREIGAIQSGAAPRSHGVLRVALMVACLPVFAAVWWKARPSEAPWPPEMTRFEAMGQAVLSAPLGPGPAWAVSVLVWIGLVVALRRGQWWLTGSWVGVLVLWLVVTSGPEGDLRDMLTGIYYNDPYRVAALLGVVTLPVAAVGLDAIGTWLMATASARFREPLARAAGIVAATVLTAGLLMATQPAPYLTQAVGRVADSYALSDGSWILTTDELALIERLPTVVESGSVIATNPWNGSSLAYAFTGLPTTTKHVFYDSTPELDAVKNLLDEADTRQAEVCPAVRSLEIQYVLDFGAQELTPSSHNPFAGFDSLADAPGFEVVDREGDAVLYRVDACR